MSSQLHPTISDVTIAGIVREQHSLIISSILGILSAVAVIWCIQYQYRAKDIRRHLWRGIVKRRDDVFSSSSSPNNGRIMVTLLIDGCNGPMRLDRNYLLQNHPTGEETNHAISFLRVVGDENRGERLWLIKALNQFLVHHNWRSEIYFDGVGVDGVTGSARIHKDDGGKDDDDDDVGSRTADGGDWDRFANELQGRSWTLSPRVTLQVTNRYDEADNVLVDRVEEEQERYNLQGPTSTTKTRQRILMKEAWNVFEKSFVSSPSSERSNTTKNNNKKNINRKADDDSIPVTSCWTFVRNESGCGKSRTLIKRYGLMRPHSVFCIFVGISKREDVHREIQTMKTIRHLLSDDVHYTSLASTMTTNTTPTTADDENNKDEDMHGNDDDIVPPIVTIVVSDDIFLRQRVVSAGGVVMTFEQLWELLVPFST